MGANRWRASGWRSSCSIEEHRQRTNSCGSERKCSDRAAPLARMAPRLDCARCTPSPVSGIDLIDLCVPSAAVAAHLAPPLGVPPETAAAAGAAGTGRAEGRKGGRAAEQWKRAALLQSPSLERSSRSRRRAIVRSTTAMPAAAADRSLRRCCCCEGAAEERQTPRTPSECSGTAAGRSCSLRSARALSTVSTSSTDAADQSGDDESGSARERGGAESANSGEEISSLHPTPPMAQSICRPAHTRNHAAIRCTPRPAMPLRDRRTRADAPRLRLDGV